MHRMIHYRGSAYAWCGPSVLQCTQFLIHDHGFVTMNILVVDDSTAMRSMIIRTLRQAGFGGNDVEQAADGAIALEAIRKSVPDLVLADWNMPNMTGIELLEALNEEGIKTIFGFITTEATPEMRAKASAGGAKFLISKPFSVESFEKILGAIM